VSLIACSRRSERPLPITLVTTLAAGNETLSQESLDIQQHFTPATGIEVRVTPTLESATERLALYREFFREHATEPDVLRIDVIWPGLLADDLVDLQPYFRPSELVQYFPALIQNATVKGRLVAIPQSVQIGLLYYRSDLLKQYGYSHPPRTWDELEAMARRIQAGERSKGKADFWGYLWQGAAYEGLTCNALEWQAGEAAGHIIEPDGVISVNNPRTRKAFERAARWVGTISPPGVVNYEEQDVWNLWTEGKAAFIRNWSWGVGRVNSLERRPNFPFAAAAIPGGGTLGGAALAVSRYSRHQAEAAKLVRYFTSPEVQMTLFRRIASLPPRPALYRDAAAIFRRAGLPDESMALSSTTVRPSAVAAGKYEEVSRAYFTTVHSILTGQCQAQECLDSLEKQLIGLTNLPVERE
jgi:trehalose/maltose transport system substrate-binding protein